MLLLLPADPLDGRRVDEHFRGEGTAAREAGHAVGLVDHDALEAGRPDEALVRLPEGDDDVVYRGWMLRPEDYRQLHVRLTARGLRLRTSPTDYRAAHELPGWFAALAAVTPESVWTDGPDLDAFEDRCRSLGPGPAVLRDFTKSLKHHWDEAAYIPDVSDAAAARRVAARFLELRADDFAGGLVLRRFETFVSAEARTWWVDGDCRLVTAHPDTPTAMPPPPDLATVGPLVAALDLPFVTVDMVLRDDGTWRVVELGDGQVSDRPSSTAPEDLVAALERRASPLVPA
ncbi:ATP-grasp domain-containing protein [Actinotalea subterranea]|uniref:ATP-grasp domain-containing protein n=1 Tax=Actinotalea subterranea TaxID=2607497 RepID=UPI0011EE9337|nr:ATP-grasp domain-containing protein [Actinotalea subterranea]